jgi:hypothetical protein
MTTENNEIHTADRAELNEHVDTTLSGPAQNWPDLLSRRSFVGSAAIASATSVSVNEWIARMPDKMAQSHLK